MLPRCVFSHLSRLVHGFSSRSCGSSSPRSLLVPLLALVALALNVLIWQPASTQAQTARPDDNRSARGRDFILSFPPNVHDNVSSSTTDSLYFFITCDVPTRGTIVYRNRTGTLRTEPFAITDPTQVFALGVAYGEYEVQGFNLDAGSQRNLNSQSERVARQSVRITAQNDVTVYALNQASLTSDACLVFPVPSLGREYVVMSYRSDGAGAAFDDARPDQSTPSQFIVVAPFDDTEVRIVPRQPTFVSRSTAPQTIRLNAGEAYLVQADVRLGNGTLDLTGSRVIASKPVAVFGSHQRAVIPSEAKGNGTLDLTTRDHLLEQLPSIETWGKSAFLTPYTRAAGSDTPTGTDLYRVLAGYDSTRIQRNGTQIAVLSAGEFFEGPLTEAAVITSNEQILVAQYKKTSSSAANKFNSDPFMMVIPTVEQYDRSYRFINPLARDRRLLSTPGVMRNNDLVFEEHYVTLVAPTTALASVRLDGSLVGVGAFQRIGASAYSFANVRVGAGVHTALADSAIGIYVYGYGLLNSYGYIGGGRLRFIAPDRNPPQIAGNFLCAGFDGIATDTLTNDSRIRSVDFENTTLGNVRAERDQFTPFADSVRFRLRLVNPNQDGSITVVVRDSIGFVSRRTIVIPGFTIGAEFDGITQSPVPQPQSALQPITRSITLPVGRSRTIAITLRNHGLFAQSLGALSLRGQTDSTRRNPAHPLQSSLQPFAPFTLQASCDLTNPASPVNASVALSTTNSAAQLGTLTNMPPAQATPSIQVIGGFQTAVLTSATSTIVFVNIEARQRGNCTLRLAAQHPCGTRELIVLNLRVDDDTTPPTVTTNRDACSRTLTFDLRDPAPAISGIQSVSATNLVNCTLTRLEPITAATVFSSQLRGVLTVLNPRLDALYTIVAADSAGNAVTLRDTIPGFTLELVPPGTLRDTVGRFGTQSLAAFTCRTLTYRNTGTRAIAIPQWTPETNIAFSLPPSQFPSVIQPNETRTFTLCFVPLEARNYTDSLRLERFCVEDIFPLSGSSEPRIAIQNTRCDVVVRLVTNSAPREYFMEQNFPNPASGSTTINLLLAQQSNVTLTIFDALGRVVETALQTTLPAGTAELTLDVSKLQTGTYFYTAVIHKHSPDSIGSGGGQGSSSATERFTRYLQVIR
jgi:hypothetical protein